MDEPSRGADREIPIGRDAEKAPGIDEDRVHVSKDEQREISARGDLICPVKSLRGGAPAPCEIEAGSDLEEHGGYQQRFAQAGAVDYAPDLHDGRMRILANKPEQVIGDMEQHVKAYDRGSQPMDDTPAPDRWRSCNGGIRGEL